MHMIMQNQILKKGMLSKQFFSVGGMGIYQILKYVGWWGEIGVLKSGKYVGWVYVGCGVGCQTFFSYYLDIFKWNSPY